MLGASESAHADGAAPGSVDALLATAKQLEKDGKAHDAHDKLVEAWHIERRYDVAAALGMNERASGDFAKAAQHLEYAIRFLPDPAKPDRLVGTPWAKPDERQKLIDAFTDVRAKVGAVRFRIDPSGEGVTIDGEKPELLGIDYDVFVMPGSRTVTVPGKPPQSVTVDSNSSVAIVAEDLPRAKEEGPHGSAPAPIATTTSSKPAWPTVLLATLTAGSAGVGIGMTVVAAQKASDAKKVAAETGCAKSPSCIATGSRDLADHNTFQAVGIAGFVGAGVALTGTLLYGLWPSGRAQAAFDPVHREGFMAIGASF